MPSLMVSVRSVLEAWQAVHAGADFIDVKDPAAGPLGQADAATLRAVVREMPPQIAVCCALGEWVDWAREPWRWPQVPAGVRYVKLGLSAIYEPTTSIGGRRRDRFRGLADPAAACAAPARRARGWSDRFAAWRDDAIDAGAVDPSTRWVAVAYADWQIADAPAPDEVLDLAERCCDGVLVDTYRKDGRIDALFDWWSRAEAEHFVHRAAARGLTVALAGSLGTQGVEAAFRIGADVVGVRGAVCMGGQREAPLEPDRVRALVATRPQGLVTA